MKIPDLAAPGPLRPWWLFPIVTGQNTNARLSLAHLGGMPRGAIAMSFAPYLADVSSTSDGDPSAGYLRWNNATQASATKIFIDDVDGDAVDHSALWATINVGGHLYLYDAADLDIWQQWTVTAVVDNTGYVAIDVTLEASNGSFAADAAVVLTLQQPSPAAGVDRGITTSVTSSGGTTTLDASLGDYFTTTLTENTTIDVINAPQGCTLTLRITQHASSAKTVAYPSSFKFPTGHDKDVSTGASARDRLVMSSDDFGATFDCALGKAHT